MPSTRSRIRSYVAAPATVGTLVAVVLAIAAGYATELVLDAYSAGFLGMMVVGVGTPSTMESHDLLSDKLVSVVGRVVLACACSLTAFFGLYLAVSESLSPFPAAAVAFVVTALASEVVARWLA